MTDQAGAEKASGESADQPTHSDAAEWRLDEEEEEDEDEYLEVSRKFWDLVPIRMRFMFAEGGLSEKTSAYPIVSRSCRELKEPSPGVMSS